MRYLWQFCLVLTGILFLASSSTVLAKGKGHGPGDRPPGWDRGEKRGWTGDRPPGLERDKKGRDKNIGEDQSDDDEVQTDGDARRGDDGRRKGPHKWKHHRPGGEATQDTTNDTRPGGESDTPGDAGSGGQITPQTDDENLSDQASPDTPQERLKRVREHLRRHMEEQTQKSSQGESPDR